MQQELLDFGPCLGKNWFNGSWPVQITHLLITFKELFLLCSIGKMGPHLRNQSLLAHSDNLAVVNIINKQSRRGTSIMQLVHRLVLACMKYNILLGCVHISGKYNILPDLLS